MAINKAKTGLGTKIILIFVIVAFVTSFVAVSTAGLFSGGRPTQTDPAAQQQGTIDSINAQYAPAANSLQQAVASDPTSYTALVSLGNTYIDWAGSVQQADQASGAPTGSDLPLWTSARDTFEKALEIQPGEPEVEGNFAIALFYTGDVDGAIEAGVAVVEANPDFSPVWFNLGNFYSAKGDTAAALDAYRQYLATDPNDERGLRQAAEAAVAELEGGATGP